MTWKKARKKPIIIQFREVDGETEEIHTKEGIVIGKKEKDFIIRGIKGEIYPIDKEIFYETFEIITEYKVDDPTFEPGMTLAEWQKRVKQFNWKRFGTECDTPMLIKALLLMGTEITELYDESVYDMQSWAFAEELADNLIRTIDFATRANINVAELITWVEPDKRTIPRMVSVCEFVIPQMKRKPTVDEKITDMFHALMRFVRIWRKHGSFQLARDELREFIQCICVIAWLTGTDLEEAMISKMAYNAQRAYTPYKGYESSKW